MRHYLELLAADAASVAEEAVLPQPVKAEAPSESTLSLAPATKQHESPEFGEALKIHEYERQRLGQELHDSAGQLLVALQLSVAHLSAVDDQPAHADLIEEIRETVRQIDQEIRTLAFLHYPVELGDRGLPSALRALAVGFARRTGIPTDIDCDCNSISLDDRAAAALLRVAQEALVNVYRHARASAVTIVMSQLGNTLKLTIADDGVGISPEAVRGPRGIGVQGMRHRMEALGGRFHIRNLRPGVSVSASVRLAPDTSNCFFFPKAG